jgi:hypothetical protein
MTDNLPERSFQYGFSIQPGARFIPDVGRFGCWLDLDGKVLLPNGPSRPLRGYDPPLAEDLLRPGERGAVVLLHPRIDLEKSDLENDSLAIHISGEFDEDQLRFSLLMFDRLVFPSSSFSLQANDPYDLTFTGAITRPHFYDLDDRGTNLAEVMGETLLQLDALHPGRWAVCRGANSAPIARRRLSAGQGFIIDLQNALPVPSKEVPIDSILTFRERRRSELLALRHHIDDIGLSVADTDAQAFPRTLALEKFDRSLADYRKAIFETNGLKNLVSIEISFNDLVTSAAAAAGGIIANLPQSSIAGMAITGMAASISVKAGAKLKAKKSSGPFEYLTRIARELS